MEENDNNKNKVPSRMARLAWPKAKYGLYLAIFIIILVLLLVYKDSILRLIQFMPKDLSKIAKQKRIKYFLISFVDLFGVLR